MIQLLPGLAAAFLSCASPFSGASVPQASGDLAAPQVLFENVRVWDGTSDGLTGPTMVLVEGNFIKAIGEAMTADANATVIDGGAHADAWPDRESCAPQSAAHDRWIREHGRP